jgi:hypothetical protein
MRPIVEPSDRYSLYWVSEQDCYLMHPNGHAMVKLSGGTGYVYKILEAFEDQRRFEKYKHRLRDCRVLAKEIIEITEGA